MARSKSLSYGLPERVKDISFWPMPSISHLTDKNLEIFNSRHRAVIMYFSDEPLIDIERDTGIDKSTIIRLVKKCLDIDEHGEIFGFTALIPYRRTKKYYRSKKSNQPILSGVSGFSGAFSKLLSQHPELEKLIKKKLYASKNDVGKNRRTIEIYRAFIKKCRELGMERECEYPFNTEQLAYVSFTKYIKRLINEEPRKVSHRLGRQFTDKQYVGDGTDRPNFDVLDRVECDGHKIDAIFCILFKSIFGDIVPLIVRRIWLISIIDVRTRVILGYHLSLNREPSANDVLQCIKNSLTVQNKKVCGYSDYEDDAGFPGNLSEDFSRLKWGEFSVDNALANTCLKVESRLVSLMGIRPKVLKRINKDDRPFIERLFLTLEQRGYHRLPSN